MCNFTPSATFHVSPDCKPETREALVRMMAAVARHHGIEAPIETTFVVREDPETIAQRLAETEVYDA